MKTSPQPLAASDVEKAFSVDFRERAFASLCNDLVWASAGVQVPSIPSFTERTSAKDRGIDASWEVDGSTDLPTTALIGPGWNVYQYKQRDAFSDKGRNSVISNLRHTLRGELKRLYEETGRRPARYVLFTNIDLLHGQKERQGREANASEESKGGRSALRSDEAIREALLDGYDDPDSLSVVVVGAAELKAFLNDLPHIRAVYFGGGRFASWERAWEAHAAETPILGVTGNNQHPALLVGHAVPLEKLHVALADPQVRVAMLTGLEGVGKSRLALEATRVRMNSTVFAMDSDVTPSELGDLTIPGRTITVVVSNPTPDVAGALVRAAITTKTSEANGAGLKLVITAPVRQGSVAPNYGMDPRVVYIPVAPLSEMESDYLLRQVSDQLDYGTHSWAIHQAGGLPRGLLLATQLGKDLRKEATSFVDAIAAALLNGLANREGQEAVEVLRLLSLLSRTGIRGPGLQELRIICRLFGGDVNAVLRTVSLLKDAGLVRIGGDSAEVTPPSLANRLAADAFRGRSDELLALFARLEPRGRTRLVTRLCSLDGHSSEEAAQFRAALLSDHGPLGSLPQALGSIGLLCEFAEAEPNRVAAKICLGLKAMSVEERFTQITGDVRLRLKDALVQMLCFRQSAAEALRSLALLAEAENDTYYSNNATGMFVEAFRWWHPQVALSLHTRFDFLSELVSSGSAVTMRLVGVKAVSGAVDSSRTFATFSSRGPRPFDTKAPTTRDDIFDYTDAMIGLLEDVAETDSELQVREAALQVISQCLLEYAKVARYEDVIRRFRRLVEDVLVGRSALSVAKLSDALEATLEHWREVTESKDSDAATVSRVIGAAAAIDELIVRLDAGPFFVRLKLWATDWNRRGSSEVGKSPDGTTVYLEEVMIGSLADELIANPSLLTEEVIDWLGSPDNQRASYLLFVVGNRDTSKGCWPPLAAVSSTLHGAPIVASYLQGMTLPDPAFVRSTTVTLFKRGHLTPQAFVYALQRLPADAETVDLAAQVVGDGSVRPAIAAQALMVGEWADTVTPDDCAIFLGAIAGQDLENGAIALDYISMWLHKKRPVYGELMELAWRCLEESSPRNDIDAHKFDRVAAELVPANSERAFALFHALCREGYAFPRSGTRWMWKPLNRYGGAGRFWKALRKQDRVRFVRTILDLVRMDEYSPLLFHIERAEGAIVQEEDNDVLTDYALEGDTHAGAVCDLLTLSTPGFWPVAFHLLEHYPHNAAISRVLKRRVSQMDRPVEIWGDGVAESANEEISRVLMASDTPDFARRWLRRVAADLSSNQVTKSDVASESTASLSDFEDNDEEIGEGRDDETAWAADLLKQRMNGQDAQRLLGETDWIE